MKTFCLGIAILAVCAALLAFFFGNPQDLEQNLRKTIGAAVLNFGLYFFLRWAEKTGKEREAREKSGNKKERKKGPHLDP